MREKCHTPLNETISTVRLSVGVEQRWGETVQETICFHLDGVLVLDPLLHGAGVERGGGVRQRDTVTHDRDGFLSL